jgi:hypothetical protein
MDASSTALPTAAVAWSKAGGQGLGTARSRHKTKTRSDAGGHTRRGMFGHSLGW